MEGLSPAWFLGIGLLVAIISTVMYLTEGSMLLFIFIGAAFLIYGLAKSVLAGKKIRNRRVSIEKQASKTKKMIVHCPKCGEPHYVRSKFCHMCGFKLS